MILVSHSLVIVRQVNVMTDPSPEESPTRYMLPDPEEGKGLVDYSLKPHSPAKYPIATKKRKKADKKKKKKTLKKEPGKSVHFKPKVALKTIYTKLKNHLEEVDLSNEDEYPLGTSEFEVKRRLQKQQLHHRLRPLTHRRVPIVHHMRKTLQRENNCSLFIIDNILPNEQDNPFDPDEFLESLSMLKQEDQTYGNPSPPSTPILYRCPVHPEQASEKRETDAQWGHWEYNKCPIKCCFVCCGSDNVEYYLDSAKRQLHEFYYRLPLDKMRHAAPTLQP